MSDEVEQYARQIEAARLAVGRGDRPAAIGTLSAVIEATRDDARLHREHVLALTELSRLHIRHSDFARAEPVLRSLLQITRAKGERHPDVATALAGLAVAKRGLGDQAAAEELYRHALEIREEVLAPDHMAIVVTLEQLSETCAARGDFAEALAHLQRALPRREGALGAEHASVHALRARITDLERRALESIVTPASSPAGAPIQAIDASTASLAPRGSRRRTVRYASVGAAVLVLAVTGFAFGSRTTNDNEGTLAQGEAEGSSAGAMASSTTMPTSTAGTSHVARADSVAATAAPAQPGANVTPAASPSEAPPAPPRVAMVLPKLRKLVLPKVAMPSLDSMMHASAKAAREAGAEIMGAGVTSRSVASNDESAVTPPMLIGSAPAPHFPDELRAQPIDGEVVVQFRVNEQGRVDPSSMQVVQSAHELFTAAVRNVLPKFRFQPARSGAPGSKPQAAWVQFRTQFAARK
jgi:TonB family protein